MSDNLPAAPLRDLIRRAAERPGTGVVEAERQKHHEKALLRAERVKRATAGVKVLVCDYSGSMASMVQGKTKYEHLTLAVADCVRQWPGIKIVAFSCTAHLVSGPADIPQPSGGTDLCAGLSVASGLNPERTVVITDGYPNDRIRALAMARQMSGIIEVVYCGNDTDAEAIKFMNELAAAGCGSQVTWDAGRLELGEAVGRLMLEAPGA